MRPSHRSPAPDLADILATANRLLAQHDLPLCGTLEPVADQDTANVNLIGRAPDRRYAIKVDVRRLNPLDRQVCVANVLRQRSGLPIPRHLCHTTGDEEPRLMVMEHLPGEQLRLLLPSLADAEALALARDWGHCIARFHATRLGAADCEGWAELDHEHAAFLTWLRAKVREVLAQIDADPAWPDGEAASLRRYLAERDSSLDEPGAPGLVKRDQGLRDTLALLEPMPHISALLDWELVTPGDTLSEIADLFVILNVAGLGRLWPSFRAGYASGGGPLPRCPQLEYYAVARTLIATTWQGQEPARRDQARELSRTLLGGASAVLGE